MKTILSFVFLFIAFAQMTGATPAVIERSECMFLLALAIFRIPLIFDNSGE
jgi:hypothetical protein